MATKLAEDGLRLERFWIKPYYNSFNGLRGFAVLLTFFTHYLIFWRAEKLADFMWTGVDLFFVISGFLITGILYDTVDDPRFFRNFYIRRALRIFPLFYGFFLVLFLVTPILHLHYPATLLAFFFYVGNLVLPFSDTARHNPTIIWMSHAGISKPFLNVGHLWSLCVEEQFYLIWPAVVWFIRDRRGLMQVCAALIIATLVARVLLVAYAPQQELNQYLVFWSTYTRCDTILVGAWMALWLRGRTLSTSRLRRTGLAFITIPVLALVAGVMFQPPLESPLDVIFNPFISSIGLSLIAVAAAGIVVLSLDEENVLSRMLRWRPLSSLGVISYGFYFLHAFPETVLLRFMRWHPYRATLGPIIAFALTLLLATLSFRFYESRFLSLKSRLAPSHRSIPSGREHVELV